MSAYTTHADLGGRADAAGPIACDDDDGEAFHAPWHARALAVTLAMGATGAWNIDMSRAARETLPDYQRLGYYEIWIGALQRLLRERGLVGDDELAAGRALRPAPALPRRLQAADVPQVLARGSPTLRTPTAPARFAVGQRVRARAGNVPHHSRLPGYAQGRCGVIERLHGAHVYADAHAQGLGEQPQWLYTVVFDGAELWGSSGAGAQRVSVDAWEPYLQPA
jgi:nitrile hydratase